MMPSLTTGQRAVAWLALALLPLASCKPRPAPRASASASTSVSAPRPAAPPARFGALRRRLVEEARALAPLAGALSRAVAARDAEGARQACASLRRPARRLEPAARMMAKLASSQLGAYGFIEPDEQAEHAGLGGLGRLLRQPSIDWQAAGRAAAVLGRAVELLPGELESQEWTAARVGRALSEGAFVLGARFDGSDSFDEEERRSDVIVEIEGLLAAVEDVRGEVPDGGAGASLDAEVTWLRGYLERVRGGRLADALSVLGATARLGAAIRAGFEALGAGAIVPPFRAKHDGGRGHLAPVSVATFPAIRWVPPASGEVALGKALFGSKLLSRNGSLSCASCHDERRAFAHPSPPALTFEGKRIARDPLALGNVAYEVFFFWDARASTTEAQIDVAVDRDMGGDWGQIESRLAADPSLRKLAEQAGVGALTHAAVHRAIVAYERTLIDDATAFDRHVRGETALTGQQQAGFDLFFGKARCSHCHRLPLTSGVEPPRLIRAEVVSIGVPARPDGKALDPDRGRGAVTGRALEEGSFKVPGLRQVGRTAPYFHNGAFATLEQVVDFYDKGGGPGLGLAVPNAAPELRPLHLDAAERAALLAFLRDGLR